MSDQESFEKFTFSMKLAAETGKDISKKVDTLNERIEKISDTITINEMPIIKAILNVTRSKSDLKKLAKALDRLSDIIELHDSLVRNVTKEKVAALGEINRPLNPSVAG